MTNYVWTCPRSGAVVVGSSPPTDGVPYAPCDEGLTARDIYFAPDGTATPLPPAPSRFAVFRPDTGWIDLPREDYWVLLRRNRDALLRACDWTSLPDAPLTEGERLAWQAYRQALRDLTDTTPDPATPVWPDPPV